MTKQQLFYHQTVSFFKFLNNPNAPSIATNSTEKLSANSKKLINLINNNSRLRDALCPDLSNEQQ
jgi:hypothetical protein